MDKVWKWIECNRFFVIGPIVAIMIWAYAVSCTPQTPSPLKPGRLVNVKQLDLDFKTWKSEQEIMAIKFEVAGEDLAEQKANNEKIENTLLGLASGGIPDMPGLLKLLIEGGGLGAIIDNIRKRGLISGLKISVKNNKQKA